MKQEEEREKKKAVAHSVLKVDKVAFSLKIMNHKYAEKVDTQWMKTSIWAVSQTKLSAGVRIRPGDL